MQTGLEELFSEVSRIDLLSREELVARYQLALRELERAIRELHLLKRQQVTEEQLHFLLQEKFQALRDELYGVSSERYKKPTDGIKKKREEVPPVPRPKLPSERYPNVPVKEVVVSQSPAPCCQQCGREMEDSGLTEDSEQLTVIPKKYEILRYKRVKYRCQCQGCMVTAPAPRRIIEGSSYSDEMILDVAASKYCDLIPMDRYVQMASRGGLEGLPGHSLIELTHGLADFLEPVYKGIREEVRGSRVLHADETPHRMLEGSETKSWYLWGFSTPRSCYLECRNTRSGDVASDFLVSSRCEVLVTDVFSGYHKAIGQANRLRDIPIRNANCNAHARRYFFKARDHYKEAFFYLDCYHEVYRLEEQIRGSPREEVLRVREEKIRPLFERMRERSADEVMRYPRGNRYGKAVNYFLENYAGLTVFLSDAEVPVDNNAQERLLRSHVVGRKTWYGTHSLRGAQTAAVLFSIVESCKLNKLNPREYLSAVTQSILAGQPAKTPAQFATT
ncbi:MAG: IS66 family transposase [Bdellovibrionaceae bacterium]|nr:IS66 family transposase [Pseudobdellovibrionaceae bacterium]